MTKMNALILTVAVALLGFHSGAFAADSTSNQGNQSAAPLFPTPNPNPNPVAGPTQPRQGLSFDAEVPDDLKTEVQNDLAFMNTLQGSGQQTKMHQQIFGSVSGDAYKSFFESRIFSVGIQSCGLAMAVACVDPSLDSNKMWITKNFTQFDHPQIARLMILYHEARHSENQHDNWSHDNCPVPFKDDQQQDMKSIWTGALLEGKPACDSTAFGSYGSSTILLKNISKYCANCTEKVKQDAGMFADDQLGRIDDPAVKASMISDFNGQ
jgi:hypothetical protein